MCFVYTRALEIRIHLTAEREHTDLTTDFQFIYHIIIEMPLRHNLSPQVKGFRNEDLNMPMGRCAGEFI